MHLAQLNVGRPQAPLDSPVMAGFVDELERINALAEASPGFVWRLQDDAGDATGIQVDALDPDVIVNLTVWTSVEALRDYAYRTEHASFLRRRREWFQPWGDGPYLVLWWIEEGHIPTVDEAVARLAQLRADGPGPDAFTFRAPEPPR